MAKQLFGVVTSTKGVNTIAVTIGRVTKHPKYLKILKRKTQLLAHNEFSNLVAGDMVKIQETKPYSKNKYFKVIEVTGKQLENNKPEEKIEKKETKKAVKKVPVKEEAEVKKTVKKTRKVSVKK